MESYFGVFKEGSWWVYTNADNTLTDSLYITKFTEYKDENCQFKRTLFKRTISLNSLNNLLAPSPLSQITYYSQENGAVFAGGGTRFYLLFWYKNNSIVNSSEKLVLKETVVVNNTTYLHVISHYEETIKSSTWIAPNVGVIKIETEQDTFLLKKYYLP